MLETFLATLKPMLTLFMFIAIGFALNKGRVLSRRAGIVMAKLETWVFCPALSYVSMATYCTVDSLHTHAINVGFGIACVCLSMLIAIPLGKVFVRKKCPERGIYTYALAFANCGYLGDPVILALFGEKALSYYKLFCLPLNMIILTWGIGILVPHGEHDDHLLKKLLTPPTTAMLLGVTAGIAGVQNYTPAFLTDTLNSLANCMGPVAMLLAGFTIANYNLNEMLHDKKVYAASALRLLVIPAAIVAALFGIKELLNLVFDIQLGNIPLFLALFATAAPLGLNTIIFPETYGGNPKTGAGMALISHTLCVVTIPIMYALMVLVFGKMPAI